MTRMGGISKALAEMQALMLNDRLDSVRLVLTSSPILRRSGNSLSIRLPENSILRASHIGHADDHLAVWVTSPDIQAIEAPINSSLSRIRSRKSYLTKENEPRRVHGCLGSRADNGLAIVPGQTHGPPDPEGAVIGYVTSMMLLDYLRPLNSNVSASGEHMKLNMPGESYPIGSPTVFCYVLKYIALKDAEDLKAALAITNFIGTLPLFPEFKGSGILISEN